MELGAGPSDGQGHVQGISLGSKFLKPNYLLVVDGAVSAPS